VDEFRCRGSRSEGEATAHGEADVISGDDYWRCCRC
jgi:hypothetical protein